MRTEAAVAGRAGDRHADCAGAGHNIGYEFLAHARGWRRRLLGREIEGGAGIAEDLPWPPETLAASEFVGMDFTMVLPGANLVPG